MRILDEYGNEVTGVDLTNGFLVDKYILKDGVTEVDFVTKHEYVEDDFECVQQYIKIDSEDVKNRRIEQLKGMLRDTDYNIIKIAEGVMTTQECDEIIKKRASWRKEINDLEAKRF